MNQDWFEMKDVRRRRLATSVWIPLRAVQTIEKHGSYGYEGFKEEFFGAGTLAVPVEKKANAEKLGWMDVGIIHEHGSYVQDGKYHPADVYEDYDGEFKGIYLVLEQRANSIETKEWHLNQDLVIALALKREGDIWVSPDEGYIEVAKLHRRNDDSPFLIEFRAEHLKDYLCARGMALYVTSYRNRDIVTNDAGHITWGDNPFCESDGGDRWEGRISEIHEGGEPFGSSTAVFHATRDDFDTEEDVPTIEFPPGGDINSKSWTKNHTGKKLYIIQGELWRNEWIEPAKASPRIGGDEPPPTVYFITDETGSQENKTTLRNEGRWLWFKPDVIMALAHRRGGSLSWYTQDTGSVRCSPDHGVHFGVNKLGQVNVYAKDIALLPDWQQRIWSGYNVSPEGGVSEELLSAQAKGIPASTQAPEKFLSKGLSLLNKLSIEKLGFSILRDHEYIPKLLESSHRFRAIDKSGLYALAKDVARLTADSIDSAAIQTIVPPPKGTKWGSLKSIENLVASKVDTEMARSMTGALVGVYELRHGDAHLPSSQVDEAFALVSVDQTAPYIHQGHQLLHACVSSIYGIIEVIRHWDKVNIKTTSL
jgi:hypothetical protein